MNTILLLAVLMGQVEVPTQLRGDSIRLKEVPLGGRVRVPSQALVMDHYGRAWLQKDYVADVAATRWDRNKELEVINNKAGWIVRVHPTWQVIDGYKIPRYPKWQVATVSGQTHVPVKGLVVVDPPMYRSPNRPTYVRLSVGSLPSFSPRLPPPPPPYYGY